MKRHPSQLNLSPLPLDKFLYSSKDQSLSAEMSDFGPAREGHWWLQRIYSDACDIGIAIRSHYTNKVEIFYLEREEVREGDLLAMYFKPLSKSCRVKSVVIFND